jgi:hypothetical protein
MDKELTVFIHNGVLLSHKEEWSFVICRKMDGAGQHNAKLKMPDSERQIKHIFSVMWNPDLKINKETKWHEHKV